MCCSVLRFVAVCCGVLQCVAVGCSKVNPRRNILVPVSVLYPLVQVSPMYVTNDIHIYYSYLYAWFILNMWAPYIIQLHFQLSTVNFQNKQWYSYILLICILAHNWLTAPLFTPASKVCVCVCVCACACARACARARVRACACVCACVYLFLYTPASTLVYVVEILKSQPYCHLI